MCLRARESHWYLDSGCSRHMTGDRSRFVTLAPSEKGFVTYGDNNKGKIIGEGSIGNSSNFILNDVLLVEGLEHNLLSISQLCDKGNEVLFTSKHCVIHDSMDRKIKFVGKRFNNTYLVNLNEISSLDSNCFSTKKEDIWLWHRRVAHINVNHLRKLLAKDLVIGLPKLDFKTEDVCIPCKKCKQAKNDFGSKW